MDTPANLDAHEVTPQLLNKAIGVLVAAIRERDTPRLWTVEDIAAWMVLSKSAVYKMIRQPGFPQPVRPIAQPRWFAEEVIEWARSHREP